MCTWLCLPVFKFKYSVIIKREISINISSCIVIENASDTPHILCRFQIHQRFSVPFPLLFESCKKCERKPVDTHLKMHVNVSFFDGQFNSGSSLFFKDSNFFRLSVCLPICATGFCTNGLWVKWDIFWNVGDLCIYSLHWGVSVTEFEHDLRSFIPSAFIQQQHLSRLQELNSKQSVGTMCARKSLKSPHFSLVMFNLNTQIIWHCLQAFMHEVVVT